MLAVDYIKSLLRQSTYTYTKHILYLRQIADNLGSLLKISTKKPNHN